MITEEYLKDNFLTAYFIDNERQNIEIESTSEDKKQVISTIIPYDQNNPQFIALSKFMNIDELHESTYERNKKNRELFEQSVIDIAKRDGLVFDQHKLDTKFYPTLVEAIFNNNENEDELFALKIALFELDTIRDSSDEEAKKKIRQATNKINALQAAFDCLDKK